VSRWRTHDGGACPVHEKAEVRVRWRNGTLATKDCPAGNLRWSNKGDDYDIAEFQVTSVEAVE
jgi:hypothetical protein